HPGRSIESPPEVRAEAALVRAALEAVGAGDAARGLDLLRDVARSSPLADWRLFVRGLAAFSRRELADARANWARLDAGRPGAQIAQTLLALSESDSGAAGAPANLAALERLAFGEPVLERLDRLRRALTQDNWRDAIREVGWLRTRVRKIEPKLAE